MPVTYRIRPSLGLIEIEVRGAATGEESTAFQKEVAEDPQFDRDLNLLIDLSCMTSISVGATEMRTLIHSTPFAPDTKRALVAGDDPLCIGIGRMFGMLSDDRFNNVRLF